MIQNGEAEIAPHTFLLVLMPPAPCCSHTGLSYTGSFLLLTCTGPVPELGGPLYIQAPEHSSRASLEPSSSA